MHVTLPDRTVRTISIDECTLEIPVTRTGHIPGHCAVEDLLRYLKVNPLTVIVSRTGKLIPEDTQLAEHDEIRIITVSHGG